MKKGVCQSTLPGLEALLLLFLVWAIWALSSSFRNQDLFLISVEEMTGGQWGGQNWDQSLPSFPPERGSGLLLGSLEGEAWTAWTHSSSLLALFLLSLTIMEMTGGQRGLQNLAALLFLSSSCKTSAFFSYKSPPALQWTCLSQPM